MELCIKPNIYKINTLCLIIQASEERYIVRNKPNWITLHIILWMLTYNETYKV